MRTLLRWGILSTARINRSIIPALRGLSRHALTSVASRSADAGERYAREWGIPRVFDSYAALVADPDIDAVYIPLPNSLHAEWTIRAAEAGKHVLCEKPFALTLAEVDDVMAAAEGSGVVVMEAFMYRHHPQTLRLKALVDEGVIGALRLIRGAFTFSLTRPGDVRLVTELGGGSLWDVGCYPVSMARYLVGQEPERVAGFQRLNSTGIDEAFYGALDFGEVHAQFDCGFCAPLRTHLEVIGTTGVITVSSPFKPGLEEQLILTRDGGTESIPILGEPLYSGQFENFADAVVAKRPPRIPLSDSRGTVAALVALYDAAVRGEVVATRS
jgi:D-xylose 1-dehydrogenase (NADP+, D-xylono-1,5-lactone-forming)